MFSRDNTEKIIEFARDYETIAAIYIFGSEATGRSRRRSDIDMAIVNRGIMHAEERIRMETLFSNILERDVDLVVFGQAGPLLQHQILKYGHLVYVSDDKERIRQEVLGRSEYMDTRFLYKEIEGIAHG